MEKIDKGFTIKLPKKSSNKMLLPIFAMFIFLFVSITFGMYFYEPVAPNIASTNPATPIVTEVRATPSIQPTELSTSKEAQEVKTVQTDSASGQVVANNKSEPSPVAPVQEFKQLVNFDFDSTEIKSYDEQSLQKFLSEHEDKNFKIMIDGHTDSIGDENYNQDLSERRANSVEQEILKIMKQQHNITKKITGYGETKPVDSNDNAEGRAHNRRVEITIIILP